MEKIYGGRRFMGERNKPEEHKESSRRIREGIWTRIKKNKRKIKENAREIYGKITIWMG